MRDMYEAYLAECDEEALQRIVTNEKQFNFDWDWFCTDFIKNDPDLKADFRKAALYKLNLRKTLKEEKESYESKP